ncbi:preprotein translocase subunit SecG [Actinocrinis sp.]|uniref:preprotein translocase subunit SecG n=1 Tax=Actinocrinis sp. TaxID=1920516 RepID=UPI002D457FAA|nr:preprotein translocase subunit SecG [Actinocrinis sp.]HZP50157.1 preprotein translocase subunit SecG [Actinocrinis sp.]HZU55574.1 preprotein translocase subunit SecG [Actinocrinis sp.]
MVIALEVILAVTSLLLIVFVLLHKGKGGGLSDMFGGGFTSQHGGSSVVEKNLDRITIVLAVIWIAAIIALGINYKP